jgi:hypothetical protein
MVWNARRMKCFLIGYMDSDYIGFINAMISTSQFDFFLGFGLISRGFVFFLGFGLISWGSKK